MRTAARYALAGLALNEIIQAWSLQMDRSALFKQAKARAAQIGRPLVIVGDPHSGAVTRLFAAYDCDESTLCLDLTGCPTCPRAMIADITKGPVPTVADDSTVVFVSAVIEYTDDPQAASREVMRMAGGPTNLFVATVRPWTVTAHLYPHARQTVSYNPTALDGSVFRVEPVGPARKALVGLGLLGLAALALGKKHG